MSYARDVHHRCPQLFAGRLNLQATRMTACTGCAEAWWVLSTVPGHVPSARHLTVLPVTAAQ